MKLGLEVVGLVLADELLVVFLSKALIGLRSLFTELFALRIGFLSVGDKVAEHVIVISIDLSCQFLTFCDLIWEIGLL